MPTRKNIILLILFFVPLFLIPGNARPETGTLTHPFTSGQCPLCHATEPSAGARESLILTDDVDTLCQRCHDGRLNVFSHPVNVVPERAVIPPDLPLSRDGKITCTTCHDPHFLCLGGGGSLRIPSSSINLCSSCHAGDRQNSGEVAHTAGLRRAHWKLNNDDAGSLDTVSLACMSCHDGSLALRDLVQVRSGSKASTFPTGACGPHPIGMNYSRLALRRPDLLPEADVNPAIKFVDSMVGCGSCHDLFSSLRKMPVALTSERGLCRECHAK